jgi:hypothetical protein
MHLQLIFNGFIIGLNLFSLCSFYLHMEWLAYLSSNVCLSYKVQPLTVVQWVCSNVGLVFMRIIGFSSQITFLKPNWFSKKNILHKRELVKVIDFCKTKNQFILSLSIPWGGGGRFKVKFGIYVCQTNIFRGGIR